MLERKIEKQIRDWIKYGNKALLLEGARQVGKTYIIRKCLEDEGCDYIELNLIERPEIIRALSSVNTANDMIVNLSLFAEKPLVKGKTVIFLDEIQEFKEVTTKIKFWVDDGSFRYVLSGSLLGVELRNIRSAPIGYLKTLSMYPMDFEEFLQLYNFTDDLKNSLEKSFHECVPVNEAIHDRLIETFNMYLNVGGMPAAVERFRETHSLEEVISEHNDIILQYKKDFTKYEREDKKPYLTKIYDLIPAELNSCGKRFNFTDLKKGLKYERSEENFVWLEDAGVALPTYNLEKPQLPLLQNEKHSLFKLYLSDVGMLTSMYGANVKRQIITAEININYGAIYENAVAQELKAHGFPLYYYNNKKRGELDFVIEYNGKVLPIEVKSGKDYRRHSALSNIIEVEEYAIDVAYVLSNYNVSVVGNIIYYPIYMLMFMDANDIDLPKIEIKGFI